MNPFSISSKFLKRVLSCLAFFGIFASQAQAQEFRVAFFDGQRILNESAPAKVASSKIEQEFSKRKKEIDDMHDRLRALYRRLEKDAPNLVDTDRVKRQREISDMEQDLDRKQRIYSEDLGQRRQEESSALVEKALKVVRQIAEAEKIDLVVQDAAYVNPRVDITDKVLKALAK